jgi:hypothetical protein
VPSKVTTTKPAGAIPEDSFKYSPLEHVRSLFVGFIQGLFAAQEPGHYRWDACLDTTEIFISDESPIHTTNVGQRPGVSVARGPVQFYSLGLDDMLSYDPATGAKRKSVLVPGTMAVHAISRVTLECERIAWWIAEELWANREELLRAGFFEIGRQPQILSPTPAGTLVQGDMADEYFATTVTCPFQFYRTTQVTPLGKTIVQHVNVAMRTRHPVVASPAMPRTDSAEPPVAARVCPPPPFSPASDARGSTTSAGEEDIVLPTTLHPLNPAQRVVLQVVRSNPRGVRPPSIGGRIIPITAPCVPDSAPTETAGGEVDVDGEEPPDGG